MPEAISAPLGTAEDDNNYTFVITAALVDISFLIALIQIKSNHGSNIFTSGQGRRWRILEMTEGSWTKGFQYTVYGALECLYNRYQCFNWSWWAVDGSSYNEDGIDADVQERRRGYKQTNSVLLYTT